jgi:hypothetical protein
VPTPGGPIPHPGHPILLDLHKPKAPLPEIVKTHFEEKHGYANYYFNKLNRDRVWKGWTAHGSFADLQGPWLLSAHVAEGGAFQVRLTADGASLKAQKTEFQWRRGDPLAAALVPPGSGGLLLALHLWRRLAVEGPAHYGEVSYLGTAPLAGVDGLVDVLSAIDAGVECRFMFHPASGDLLALELVSSDDADPCEIRFSDYRQLDGRALPQRLDVRCGDDDFGALMIDSVQFEKTASKP